MNNWTKLTKEEQFTILANIAEDKGIVDNAVEKDYWVSMVLRAIFSLPYATAFVFKGGTSLSKGWGLIERFSEDIDLVIDPKHLGFADVATKSQRTKLRKDSKKFIDGIFALDIEDKLKEFGLSECCKVIVPETSVSDLDPVVLFIEYNSVLQTKMQYIPERVKIEISCRSLMEPSEGVKMCSMIEDAYPDEEFSLPIFIVPVVVPGRTFLEKVFLLHEEFSRPNGCTHIERITRHMYDIVKMMDKPFAMEAMQNVQLYEDIVAHRKKFTAWSGLDYTTHLPNTISFLPPVSIEGVLREDYKQMQIGFIYADAPSFDEIMERLQDLHDRFRSLKWKK
ncbi:nucleotidyl transferase AbiEii/AbiGii toxin family protein [Massilibacteroides sp.]|uniref:nucleotidyl transferase AbiEii/AbiGii toxin family protein n=1 Tax=Massilibacteroides sp. TaxID=2034766 RepID=UPI0026396E93|nr:nucleotidyl transferase AbiEii/AbiGii toxin family protein [Massilibacteroides sp.]MDD4516447.1 nucleotidyl transferase AbiEii/AbiGii toxin family protein [Massilibacteroides sp.]